MDRPTTDKAGFTANRFFNMDGIAITTVPTSSPYKLQLILKRFERAWGGGGGVGWRGGGGGVSDVKSKGNRKGTFAMLPVLFKFN